MTEPAYVSPAVDEHPAINEQAIRFLWRLTANPTTYPGREELTHLLSMVRADERSKHTTPRDTDGRL